MSKLTWTLLLIASMACIGAFYPIAKFLAGSIEPLVVAFFRFALAALALLPVMLYQRSIRVPRREDIFWLFLVAVCGIVPTVFIVVGVESTNSVVAAILINTNPLVIALLSPLLISERVRAGAKVGLVVGFLGVVAIVLNGESIFNLFNSAYVWGALILSSAAIFAGFSKIYAKGLVRIYDGLYVTFFGTLISSVVLALILAFTGKFAAVVDFSSSQILALVAVGIICTALPWTIWNSSLTHLDVHVAASFNLLIPIFTTFYSFLFLDESLSMWIFAGMLLTSLGVYVVQKEEPRPAIIQ